ncbi:epidermal growth factor receptor substrate 15-like isoform X1 [Tiliqua scincoides]|uniref:epidermal growth factor receptor substrate 15-like isoform X1 n=1 Tax=Tiliqua scincoides TaxID=71010 RepID=UPI0034629325
MEGLKSELRSLRQQVFQQSDGDCTPDLCSSPGIMQDMLESKKALWQEYKCIRREIEQLKHKLDRQEEDLFNQVSATHEIKRTQRQYCRMLEDLMNSHKAQTQDLDKARNETQSTQQELGHIKSTVTVLKEQVESLHLEDKLHAMSLKEESSHLKKNKELLHYGVLSSLLCDYSASELSLTDVSSDELSSEPEMEELADDKIFIPDLELEQSTPGGATGNRLEGAELNSELSTSLPELNLSDLISLT